MPADPPRVSSHISVWRWCLRAAGNAPALGACDREHLLPAAFLVEYRRLQITPHDLQRLQAQFLFHEPAVGFQYRC